MPKSCVTCLPCRWRSSLILHGSAPGNCSSQRATCRLYIPAIGSQNSVNERLPCASSVEHLLLLHFPEWSSRRLLLPGSSLTVLTEPLNEVFPQAFSLQLNLRNASLRLTRLCTQCSSLFCPRSPSEHLIPSVNGWGFS